MENGDHKALMETASSYVKEVKSIDHQTEALEEQLKILKEKKVKITQYDLPALLFEHGMNSITLMDDTRISIQPLYYARDNVDPTAFHKWLQDNGHGGIVKNHFEVWSRDSNTISFLQQFCERFGIENTVKEEVHWKTLEKWFQEVMTAGQVINTDLFTNHVGSVAKIK